jgi:hypothetical protein
LKLSYQFLSLHDLLFLKKEINVDASVLAAGKKTPSVQIDLSHWKAFEKYLQSVCHKDDHFQEFANKLCSFHYFYLFEVLMQPGNGTIRKSSGSTKTNNYLSLFENIPIEAWENFLLVYYSNNYNIITKSANTKSNQHQQNYSQSGKSSSVEDKDKFFHEKHLEGKENLKKKNDYITLIYNLILQWIEQIIIDGNLYFQHFSVAKKQFHLFSNCINLTKYDFLQYYKLFIYRERLLRSYSIQSSSSTTIGFNLLNYFFDPFNTEKSKEFTFWKEKNLLLQDIAYFYQKNYFHQQPQSSFVTQQLDIIDEINNKYPFNTFVTQVQLSKAKQFSKENFDAIITCIVNYHLNDHHAECNARSLLPYLLPLISLGHYSLAMKIMEKAQKEGLTFASSNNSSTGKPTPAQQHRESGEKKGEDDDSKKKEEISFQNIPVETFYHLFPLTYSSYEDEVRNILITYRNNLFSSSSSSSSAENESANEMLCYYILTPVHYAIQDQQWDFLILFFQLFPNFLIDFFQLFEFIELTNNYYGWFQFLKIFMTHYQNNNPLFTSFYSHYSYDYQYCVMKEAFLQKQSKQYYFFKGLSSTYQNRINPFIELHKEEQKSGNELKDKADKERMKKVEEETGIKFSEDQKNDKNNSNHQKKRASDTMKDNQLIEIYKLSKHYILQIIYPNQSHSHHHELKQLFAQNSSFSSLFPVLSLKQDYSNDHKYRHFNYLIENFQNFRLNPSLTSSSTSSSSPNDGIKNVKFVTMDGNSLTLKEIIQSPINLLRCLPQSNENKGFGVFSQNLLLLMTMHHQHDIIDVFNKRDNKRGDDIIAEEFVDLISSKLDSNFQSLKNVWNSLFLRSDNHGLSSIYLYLLDGKYEKSAEILSVLFPPKKQPSTVGFSKFQTISPTKGESSYVTPAIINNNSIVKSEKTFKNHYWHQIDLLANHSLFQKYSALQSIYLFDFFSSLRLPTDPNQGNNSLPYINLNDLLRQDYFTHSLMNSHNPSSHQDQKKKKEKNAPLSSFAFLQQYSLALQYCKYLWKAILKHNFLRFIQFSSATPFSKMDSFIRAKQILTLLNIPFSHLMNNINSELLMENISNISPIRKTASSEEKNNTPYKSPGINPITASNSAANTPSNVDNNMKRMENQFLFDPFSFNNRITHSLYSQLKYLISGFYHLRMDANANLKNANKSLVDSLISFHQPYLSCLLLGKSDLPLEEYLSRLEKKQPMTAPSTTSTIGVGGASGSSFQIPLHYLPCYINNSNNNDTSGQTMDNIERDLLKMISIELSNQKDDNMLATAGGKTTDSPDRSLPGNNEAFARMKSGILSSFSNFNQANNNNSSSFYGKTTQHGNLPLSRPNIMSDPQALLEALQSAYLIIEFAHALCYCKVVSIITLDLTSSMSTLSTPSVESEDSEDTVDYDYPVSSLNIIMNDAVRQSPSRFMVSSSKTSGPEFKKSKLLAKENLMILSETNLRYQYHPYVLSERLLNSFKFQLFVMNDLLKSSSALHSSYMNSPNTMNNNSTSMGGMKGINERIKFFDYITPNELKLFFKFNSFYSSRFNQLREICSNGLASLFIDLQKANFCELICRLTLQNSNNNNQNGEGNAGAILPFPSVVKPGEAANKNEETKDGRVVDSQTGNGKANNNNNPKPSTTSSGSKLVDQVENFQEILSLLQSFTIQDFWYPILLQKKEHRSNDLGKNDNKTSSNNDSDTSGMYQTFLSRFSSSSIPSAGPTLNNLNATTFSQSNNPMFMALREGKLLSISFEEEIKVISLLSKAVSNESKLSSSGKTNNQQRMDQMISETIQSLNTCLRVGSLLYWAMTSIQGLLTQSKPTATAPDESARGNMLLTEQEMTSLHPLSYRIQHLYDNDIIYCQFQQKEKFHPLIAISLSTVYQQQRFQVQHKNQLRKLFKQKRTRSSSFSENCNKRGESGSLRSPNSFRKTLRGSESFTFGRGQLFDESAYHTNASPTRKRRNMSFSTDNGTSYMKDCCQSILTNYSLKFYENDFYQRSALDIVTLTGNYELLHLFLSSVFDLPGSEKQHSSPTKSLSVQENERLQKEKQIFSPLQKTKYRYLLWHLLMQIPSFHKFEIKNKNSEKALNSNSLHFENEFISVTSLFSYYQCIELLIDCQFSYEAPIYADPTSSAHLTLTCLDLMILKQVPLSILEKFLTIYEKDFFNRSMESQQRIQNRFHSHWFSLGLLSLMNNQQYSLLNQTYQFRTNVKTPDSEDLGDDDRYQLIFGKLLSFTLQALGISSSSTSKTAQKETIVQEMINSFTNYFLSLQFFEEILSFHSSYLTRILFIPTYNYNNYQAASSEGGNNSTAEVKGNSKELFLHLQRTILLVMNSLKSFLYPYESKFHYRFLTRYLSFDDDRKRKNKEENSLNTMIKEKYHSVHSFEEEDDHSSSLPVFCPLQRDLQFIISIYNSLLEHSMTLKEMKSKLAEYQKSIAALHYLPAAQQPNITNPLMSTQLPSLNSYYSLSSTIRLLSPARNDKTGVTNKNSSAFPFDGNNNQAGSLTVLPSVYSSLQWNLLLAAVIADHVPSFELLFEKYFPFPYFSFSYSSLSGETHEEEGESKQSQEDILTMILLKLLSGDGNNKDQREEQGSSSGIPYLTERKGIECLQRLFLLMIEYHSEKIFNCFWQLLFNYFHEMTMKKQQEAKNRPEEEGTFEGKKIEAEEKEGHPENGLFHLWMKLAINTPIVVPMIPSLSKLFPSDKDNIAPPSEPTSSLTLLHFALFQRPVQSTFLSFFLYYSHLDLSFLNNLFFSYYYPEDSLLIVLNYLLNQLEEKEKKRAQRMKEEEGVLTEDDDDNEHVLISFLQQNHENQQNIFHILSRYGHTTIVTFLLTPLSSSSSSSTTTSCVIQTLLFPVYQDLLQQEDEYGYLPIHYAISSGHSKITQLFKEFIPLKMKNAIKEIVYFFRILLLSRSNLQFQEKKKVLVNKLQRMKKYGR